MVPFSPASGYINRVAGVLAARHYHPLLILLLLVIVIAMYVPLESSLMAESDSCLLPCRSKTTASLPCRKIIAQSPAGRPCRTHYHCHCRCRKTSESFGLPSKPSRSSLIMNSKLSDFGRASVYLRSQSTVIPADPAHAARPTLSIGAPLLGSPLTGSNTSHGRISPSALGRKTKRWVSTEVVSPLIPHSGKV